MYNRTRTTISTIDVVYNDYIRCRLNGRSQILRVRESGMCNTTEVDAIRCQSTQTTE